MQIREKRRPFPAGKCKRPQVRCTYTSPGEGSSKLAGGLGDPQLIPRFNIWSSISGREAPGEEGRLRRIAAGIVWEECKLAELNDKLLSLMWVHWVRMLSQSGVLRGTQTTYLESQPVIDEYISCRWRYTCSWARVINESRPLSTTRAVGGWCTCCGVVPGPRGSPNKEPQ